MGFGGACCLVLWRMHISLIHRKCGVSALDDNERQEIFIGRIGGCNWGGRG